MESGVAANADEPHDDGNESDDASDGESHDDGHESEKRTKPR